MAVKYVFIQLQSWKFPEYSAVLSDNYIFKNQFSNVKKR